MQKSPSRHWVIHTYIYTKVVQKVKNVLPYKDIYWQQERNRICRFYHTPSPTSPHSHLGQWGTCRTVTPVYLFPPRTRRSRYPTCTNFAVLQMFGDNFVHNCTRHFRTLFVHFANCETRLSRMMRSPFASMRLWWQRVALISQCHEHLFAHS